MLGLLLLLELSHVLISDNKELGNTAKKGLGGCGCGWVYLAIARESARAGAVTRV